MFDFARADGLRDDNPARGIEDDKTTSASVPTTTEIGTLGDELAAAEARGENPSAINALRLLRLTGCRKNEILTLKWEHIDVERRCLNLPAAKACS